MEQNTSQPEVVWGLDLGTGSIGYAVVAMSERPEIRDAGVHLFDKAEHPKDGESLAKPRRDARGARRRLNRRAKRLRALNWLLVKEGGLDLPTHWDTQPMNKNPWDLRAQGLDRVLTDTEFAVVLRHLLKHRGFQSSAKDLAEGQDTKVDATFRREQLWLYLGGHTNITSVHDVVKDQELHVCFEVRDPETLTQDPEMTLEQTGNTVCYTADDKRTATKIRKDLKERIAQHHAKDKQAPDHEEGLANNASETQRMKLGMLQVRLGFQASATRTIGEYFVLLREQSNDPQFKMRNGDGNYTNSIPRSLILDEANSLFEAQRRLGNPKATPELQEKFCGVSSSKTERKSLLMQRRGMPSFEDKVGMCELEPGYRRAPKDSITADIFRAYASIAHCRCGFSPNYKDYIPLSEPLYERLVQAAKNKTELNYVDLRKVIEADDRFIEMLRGSASFQEMSKHYPDLDPIDFRFNHGFSLSQYQDNKSSTDADSKSSKPKNTAKLRKDVQTTEYYDIQEREKEAEQKKKFIALPGYHKLKKTLSNLDGVNYWDQWKDNTELLDAIVYAVAYLKEYKNWEDLQDQETRELLKPLDNTPHQVGGIEQGSVLQALFERLFLDGTMQWSLQAIRKIIPHLPSTGSTENAKEKAGYARRRPCEPQEKLPPLKDSPFDQALTNPVVRRTLARLRKVVNALIDTHGKPDRMVIELARDLGNTKKQKEQIAKEQKAREDAKKTILKDWAEYGWNLRNDQVDIVRLYKEQRGQCPYTLRAISHADLVQQFKGAGNLQVDHILPFSRSMDDSLNNKVLVFASANQEKQEHTPYEWSLAGGLDFHALTAYVDACQAMPKSKKDRLLLKEFSPEDSKNYMTRHINDTRFISKMALEYLRYYLTPQQEDDEATWNYSQKYVKSVKGSITEKVRHYVLDTYHQGVNSLFVWKDRTTDVLHHMTDAIILACAEERITQRITKGEQWLQDQGIGSHMGDPKPGQTRSDRYERDHIKNKVRARYRALFGEDFSDILFTHWLDALERKGMYENRLPVSRMVHDKHTGQAHEETIYSRRHIDGKDPMVVKTLALSKVKQSDIKNMVDSERNWKLRDRLLARVQADPKNPWVAPLHMPLKGEDPRDHTSTLGPIVRSIKVKDNMKHGQILPNLSSSRRDGFVTNGSMLRIDVFAKKIGEPSYVAIPVYVPDMIKETLPSRYCVTNKPWPEVDLESYAFLFSLRQNDYIRAYKTNGKVVEGYVAGLFDTANAQITKVVRFNVHASATPETKKEKQTKTETERETPFEQRKRENKMAIAEKKAEWIAQSMGILTLQKLEKYKINILGHLEKVSFETRAGTLPMKKKAHQQRSTQDGVEKPNRRQS